jgi:hypothetical protein
MKGRTRTLLTLGILGLAGAAALLPAGCQSSGTAVTTGTSQVCPLCHQPTHMQSLEAAQCTKVVCPICQNSADLNAPLFREQLERFSGGPVSLTIPYCESCQVAVVPCATCRAKQGS